MEEFDLVVIGGGPGGYTGAIRASQLGMKVACIEKRKTLGGTCLNVGCIPSKALLNFSEKYEEARSCFNDIGIENNATLNLDKMLSQKDKIVSDLCSGINSLFTKNKITKFTGTGKLIEHNIVEINDGSKTQKIKADKILIATGSSILEVAGIEIDEKSIVSSTGALNLSEVPKELIIIGGGYIGLELGSVWKRLGSNVTVIEYADRIVPALDQEIGNAFHKILEKQGFKFILNSKVTEAQDKSGKVSLVIENQSGDTETLSCDVMLVSIGRKPNVQDLGLDIIDIKLDERGRIIVNDQFQTNISNIYAIGDVIDGPMLAHKAEEEAVSAVEIMNNQDATQVNYNLIPGVVYTWPEVASVGFTEEELKDANIEFKTGKFPFLANSRARASMNSDGMVKLLACSKTDKILGAHIIGPDAGTLIGEVAAYMKLNGTTKDIIHTCHAHPTLNEAIKEAALAIEKRTINF